MGLRFIVVRLHAGRLRRVRPARRRTRPRRRLTHRLLDARHGSAPTGAEPVGQLCIRFRESVPLRARRPEELSAWDADLVEREA